MGLQHVLLLMQLVYLLCVIDAFGKIFTRHQFLYGICTALLFSFDDGDLRFKLRNRLRQGVLEEALRRLPER